MQGAIGFLMRISQGSPTQEDGALTSAMFGLSPQVIETDADHGPKIIPRCCKRCAGEYLVTEQHAAEVPESFPLQFCEDCDEQILASEGLDDAERPFWESALLQMSTV